MAARDEGEKGAGAGVFSLAALRGEMEGSVCGLLPGAPCSGDRNDGTKNGSRQVIDEYLDASGSKVAFNQ